MGKHMYFRICVDFEKDHSTGGKTSKQIGQNITSNIFNPYDYITHSKYDLNKIKNISFICIESNRCKLFKKILFIVQFECKDGNVINIEKFKPHIMSNEKWNPLCVNIHDQYYTKINRLKLVVDRSTNIAFGKYV